MSNVALRLDSRRAGTRVGEIVCDRWRLDELLGNGGMGAVYSATHRNGMRVAIKIMHRELSLNDELRERFYAEARIANSVAHPSVIAVLDEGETDVGEPLLVMELLQGQTLLDRFECRHESLELTEALNIADQLLDVLAAAHSRGIVHRDIKPENVFLTHDGRVKVLDFGVAHVAGRVRTTSPGSTVGTPGFMPPEQARGHHTQLDGRSDLWAVGATLFWLLSGRLVHQGETANEELLAAMTQAAPPLLTVVPHAHASVAGLVDKALAFEPAARFEDARSMQSAVRSIRRSLVPTATLPQLTELLPDLSVEARDVLARTTFAWADPRASLDAAVYSRSESELRPPPASRSRYVWLTAAAALLLVLGSAFGHKWAPEANDPPAAGSPLGALQPPVAAAALPAPLPSVTQTPLNAPSACASAETRQPLARGK